MIQRITWKYTTCLIVAAIGIGIPSLAAAQTSSRIAFSGPSFDNSPVESLNQGSISNSNGTTQDAPATDATNPVQQVIQNQDVVANQMGQANVVGDEVLFTGNVYGAFDFMFLRRSGPSPQILAVTDGVPSLNTADFSYDYKFAPQLTLGIGDPFGYGFEFNYFNSEHEFNGVRAGTAVTPIFFGGTPAVPVSSYDILAKTATNNYELNQWVRLNDRTRLGLGLRIIDMREEYNITETGTSSGFFCTSDNELYGGQFAAQYFVVRNDIATVYFEGKSGLFYNNAKVRATSANAEINPSSSEFSYAGDLRLVADLPVTDIFSFRFGYHATLMTGIAQALDQNDDLNIFNPANPGDFDLSSVWFHGGFFGLVGHY